MINSASHDSVLSLVAGRPVCLNTVLDKAVANIDCKSVLLRCQLRISIMNQLGTMSKSIEDSTKASDHKR